MKWFKNLTRELPFHTLENWKYVYFKGWVKFIDFGLKNAVYYSKRNVVEIYRVKEENEALLNRLKELCLKNPKLIIYYYNELERLDKKIISLSKKKIKTKSQLKEYIQEIDKMMNYYCTIYLIKVYSNFVITEEVVKKQPKLAKKAKDLLKKAEWFKLSEAVIQNASSVLNLPKKVVSMLRLKEILKYIETGYIDYELVEKRYNGIVWNLTTNELYYGEQAKEYIKSLKITEEKTEKTNIIKGTVASKGKAKGKVIIALSTEDFPKIKQGSILVANMTTPWYTPYLSKVQAIVTDEGGIGCHASIIARELGIPCVIGTKIATSIFKDGDLVEVDADKGIVKKIK